jgi:hypothetical protein
MVELPHKDINECLMNGMTAMNSGTWSALNSSIPMNFALRVISFRKHGCIRTSGYRSVFQPVGFAEQQFKFRAGELTLVNG